MTNDELPVAKGDAAGEVRPSAFDIRHSSLHKRRPRYAGKNPRRFEEKYKEHSAAQHPETIAKVLAAGKTPAGSHRPIMVAEMLEVLAPRPGEVAADCTLGHGGHAEALLHRLQPGGRLIGLDVDPRELPRTETRLRGLGFDEQTFRARRCNYAGLAKVLGEEEIAGADVIVADLGVSSMQIDDPARGFSVKGEGPLDMRMNPERGQPASALLAKMSAAELTEILRENADEPRAEPLAAALAGRTFTSTRALREAVLHVAAASSRSPKRQDAASTLNSDDERELTVRRVFQALRIAVNDEFAALEAFLRQLPNCLAPGGRVAILTFHSGEDRRVKKSFAEHLRQGLFAAIAPEVVRASPAERRENPRSIPAKLRWARR